MENILFVCTGNACRSQIAEGLGKELSNGRYEIRSAGITPFGVHPTAIETMKEVGIDISEHTSDLLTSSMIDQTDYVITLCNTARDNCPAIPSGVRHLHWDIPNPDKLYPSEEARRKGFARMRDDLEKRVQELLDQLD